MPANETLNALSEEELMKCAKEELGEDPKMMEESVKALRTWISQSPHLNGCVRTDDQILNMFLRGCKYSLERAKEKFDFFYTVRGNLPEWFDNWNPYQPTVQKALNWGVYLPLRGYDKHGRFVVLMRNGQSNPNEIKMEDMFKVSTMVMELASNGLPQVQIKGLVLIQDMEGMTANHALQMNPAMAKKAMTVWQDAYPAKPKALHFLNMPPVMESIFSMVQSFQKQKMKERTVVHARGGTYDKLHEDVGKDVLPVEYGGTNGTVAELTEYWKKRVEDGKDWLEEQTRYKTNEKKRVGKPKNFSDIFGIEGSFRKLEID